MTVEELTVDIGRSVSVCMSLRLNGSAGSVLSREISLLGLLIGK